MEACTDEQLVMWIRQDCAEAFVELAKRYMSLIQAKASTFCNGDLEADDLYQEGLLGLFRAAKSYDGEKNASFRTYAGVCIARRMITAHRASVRKRDLPAHICVSLNDTEYQDLEKDICSPVSDPESLLIAREAFQTLHTRLQNQLTPLEQKVLFLHVRGCRYSTIARKLGISSKSVDNALQRVRRKMREFC